MSTSPSSPIAHKLARPNILQLTPYRCARDDYKDGILLDANENSFGPSLGTDKNNNYNALTLERYPDPYQTELKKKYCHYRNGQDDNNNSFLTPAHLFCGNGSDEAIDLLLRSFCEPQSNKILTTPPTYGMYAVCAHIQHVDILRVPLHSDFSLNVPAVIDALQADNGIQLVFLCTPGNPTSKHLELSAIEQVAQAATDTAIVVVDEAYVDFSAFPSALSLLRNYSNVVVLQTLSKAFGLAGIRCGFCLGPPDIIQILNNVKAPYNVNKLTSQMALQALNHTEQLQGTIAAILQQRSRVSDALSQLDFVETVYPSDANFLLFRLQENALQVYQKLAEQCAVVTRYRGKELHCDNCIRVSIGTADENTAFLEQLVQVYQSLLQ